MEDRLPSGGVSLNVVGEEENLGCGIEAARKVLKNPPFAS